MLGFNQTYPIMCTVDIFTVSSTLSCRVLVSTIKQILNEGNMLTAKEKADQVQNFNTSKQVQSVTEKFFLAMMYLTKGSEIDVKSIGQEVNK